MFLEEPISKCDVNAFLDCFFVTKKKHVLFNLGSYTFFKHFHFAELFQWLFLSSFSIF